MTTLQPILLLYLGSPANSGREAVGRYLREFLSDPDVMSLPAPLRYALVRGIIIPARKGASSAKYRRLEELSGGALPMPRYMHALSLALAERIGRPVVPVPRYGLGGEMGLLQLLQQYGVAGARAFTLYPLYPQYTSSTAYSALAHMQGLLGRLYPKAELRLGAPFYNRPEYIGALRESVLQHPHAAQLLAGGATLVQSFHSIPVGHRKRDAAHLSIPYRFQCSETARLLADALGVAQTSRILAFQSRMGKGRWEEPYTEELLPRLAAERGGNFVIITPGFFCDCLETLYDLHDKLRPRMLAAGAQTVEPVPCLNDTPAAVELLCSLFGHS